jgi:uncharacterized MAPEG superfamily protein
MSKLPTEIVVLGLSVVLLLVQLFLQGFLSTLERGGAYNAGPRDEARPVQGKFAGRADRAFRNLLETYPVFVALALALTVIERAGGWGAIGAQVWLAARVAFVMVYVSGVPMIRSIVWLASIFGLVAMLVRLFQ